MPAIGFVQDYHHLISLLGYFKNISTVHHNGKQLRWQEQPFFTVRSIGSCQKINWKCRDSRAPFKRSLLLESHVVLTKIISHIWVHLLSKLFFRRRNSFLYISVPFCQPVPRIYFISLKWMKCIMFCPTQSVNERYEFPFSW